MLSQSESAVPIVALRALAGLAIRNGWDADELMLSAGIAPQTLRNRGSRVTPEQVGRLVKALACAADDEMLGLGAAAVPPGTLRMLGHALLGAADLGHAVQRFQDFKRALPGIPGIDLVAPGATARLSFEISAFARPMGVLVDTVLAVTHRIMAWATNSRIQLERVELPHALALDIDDYDIVFGAPVVSNAAEPALIFPATVLVSPIVRTQEDLDNFSRNAMAEIVSRRDYALLFEDQVRRILEDCKTRQWLDAEDTAARLAISPQTMRRKLRQEGSSFSQIREDVRRHAAITSLAIGQESIAALSRRLGFSEPSAFTRAFRRWTGTAPSDFLSSDRLETVRASKQGRNPMPHNAAHAFCDASTCRPSRTAGADPNLKEVVSCRRVGA
jgi:AraC-like DNA-binding protein